MQFKFRYIVWIVGIISTFALVNVLDPTEQGASSVFLLKTLGFFSISAFLIHFGSRSMFDYIDRYEYFKVALKEPYGAGLALIALALFAIAFAIVFSALAYLPI